MLDMDLVPVDDITEDTRVQETEPEKKLWSAVILQSFKDAQENHELVINLANELDGATPREYSCLVRRITTTVHHLSDLRIMVESEWFEWICHSAGVDHGLFKSRLIKVIRGDMKLDKYRLSKHNWNDRKPRI